MHLGTWYIDFRILFPPLFEHEIQDWVYNSDSFRTELGSIVNHVLNNFFPKLCGTVCDEANVFFLLFAPPLK